MARQRLVSLDGAPATSGQQPEALVEPGADVGRAQCDDARGRELDRERYPVEPPAHVGDGGGVRRVDAEPRSCRGSTFGEQRERVLDRQRAQRPGLFPVDAQALSAGGQHAHAGTGAQDRESEVTRRLHEVLAVVEDEECSAAP